MDSMDSHTILSKNYVVVVKIISHTHGSLRSIMRKRSTWTQLEQFEGHEINTRGEVRTIKSGHILHSSTNQTGVRYVGMRNTTEGKYQNRALSTLVAETFVPGRDHEHDTVLHLDGNKDNVEAGNLLWTTRWHAIAYHQEILLPRFTQTKRIIDGNGRRYRSVAHAAMASSALPSQIEYAIRYNDTLAVDEHFNFVHRVNPGGHVYRSA